MHLLIFHRELMRPAMNRELFRFTDGQNVAAFQAL